MNRNTNRRTQNTRRRIETFEPSGPVAMMIDNELRGLSRGMKTRLFERCIVAALGKKYPKLAERYRMLCEEAFRDVSRQADADYRAEVGRSQPMKRAA